MINILNYGAQIDVLSMVRRLYVLLATLIGISYNGRVWGICHGPEQKPEFASLATRSDTTIIAKMN